MSMIFDPKEELDHIAEFADSGVRVFQRQGSLVGIKGAYGLKKWLYHKWRNRGNAVYTFGGVAGRNRAQWPVGVHRQAAARVPEPRRHRVPDFRDADGRGRDAS